MTLLGRSGTSETASASSSDATWRADSDTLLRGRVANLFFSWEIHHLCPSNEAYQPVWSGFCLYPSLLERSAAANPPNGAFQPPWRGFRANPSCVPTIAANPCIRRLCYITVSKPVPKSKCRKTSKSMVDRTGNQRPEMASRRLFHYSVDSTSSEWLISVRPPDVN